MNMTKKLIAVIMVCGVAAYAQAADHTTLNAESIQKFISIFPEYKALLQNYGENASADSVNPATGLKLKNELDTLCDKYGLTMQEFTTLAQKVSIGYSALQMQNSGMDPGQMNVMQMVSEKEVAALKPYEAQLGRLFAE